MAKHKVNTTHKNIVSMTKCNVFSIFILVLPTMYVEHVIRIPLCTVVYHTRECVRV
jgi:hypothetical protein